MQKLRSTRVSVDGNGVFARQVTGVMNAIQGMFSALDRGCFRRPHQFLVLAPSELYCFAREDRILVQEDRPEFPFFFDAFN